MIPPRESVIRQIVLHLLHARKEVTYPELLMNVEAKPEEIKEVLRCLEKENKIQRKTIKGELEVYSLVHSFLERFAY